MSARLHVVAPEPASEALAASQAVVDVLRESVQSVHASVVASRQRVQESYELLAQSIEQLATSPRVRFS